MDAGQKGETFLLRIPVEPQTFPHPFSLAFSSFSVSKEVSVFSVVPEGCTPHRAGTGI